MSKTVRYKLTGVEAKFVTETLNALRSSGITKATTTAFAKASLIEACAGIRNRIKEAQAQEEAHTDDTTIDTEADTGTEQQREDADSDTLADSSDAPDQG